MTRTIPSKEQVLEAASKCPETKETLRILFPQDFEVEFDWRDLRRHPFKYLKIEEDNHIVPTKELKNALKSIGKPIPSHLYPWTYLRTAAQLLIFISDNMPESD